MFGPNTHPLLGTRLHLLIHTHPTAAHPCSVTCIAINSVGVASPQSLTGLLTTITAE